GSSIATWRGNCRSGPARGPPSSCPAAPRARPSSTAAATSRRRTSSRSATTCYGTGSASPTRPRPRTSPPRTCSSASSTSSRCPDRRHSHDTDCPARPCRGILAPSREGEEGPMTSTTTAQPVTYGDAAALARFSVARYQRMIEAGILTADDKVELLENYVVLKMPRNPPHDGTIQRMLERLFPHRPAGWS